jgi:hypothetical protein
MNVFIVDRRQTRWSISLQPAGSVENNVPACVLVEFGEVLAPNAVKVWSTALYGRLPQFMKDLTPDWHVASPLIGMVGRRDAVGLARCRPIGVKPAIRLAPVLVNTHDIANAWTLKRLLEEFGVRVRAGWWRVCLSRSHRYLLATRVHRLAAFSSVRGVQASPLGYCGLEAPPTPATVVSTIQQRSGAEKAAENGPLIRRLGRSARR